jgi:hypothetical protein
MLPQPLTHDGFAAHHLFLPFEFTCQVAKTRQVALAAKKGFGSTAKQVGNLQQLSATGDNLMQGPAHCTHPASSRCTCCLCPDHLVIRCIPVLHIT